nr:MAG TPA: hypothetical protein [Caudoviricetes sp.]
MIVRPLSSHTVLVSIQFFPCSAEATTKQTI